MSTARIGWIPKAWSCNCNSITWANTPVHHKGAKIHYIKNKTSMLKATKYIKFINDPARPQYLTMAVYRLTAVWGLVTVDAARGFVNTVVVPSGFGLTAPAVLGRGGAPLDSLTAFLCLANNFA